MDRYAAYKVWKNKIDQAGGYDKFSKGYEILGFTISKDGITYREWAPNAKEAFLFGDFSTLPLSLSLLTNLAISLLSFCKVDGRH